MILYSDVVFAYIAQYSGFTAETKIFRLILIPNLSWKSGRCSLIAGITASSMKPSPVFSRNPPKNVQIVIAVVVKTYKAFKTFPTYNKSAADDFENIFTKIWNIYIK